jgi:hypothetical protein
MSRFFLLVLITFGFQFTQSQCIPATQFEYSNFTGTSVQLNWQSTGSATLWEVEFGVAPYTQGSGGVIIATAANNMIISGLTPGVQYEFYVRSICGSESSTFVGPLLVPGNYNSISGNVSYDIDLNGCTTSDPGATGLLITATDASSGIDFYAVTDVNGDYILYVPDGIFNVSSVFLNSSISALPASATINFPNATNSATQDFCLTPTAIEEDIAVRIIPLFQARPGFDVSYEITVMNQGTVPVSDALLFTYPNDVMNLLTAVPSVTASTANSLSWDYSLQPLQSLTYEISFNLNPPTHPTFPLNGGDVINFSASTYLTGADVNLLNNTDQLYQTLVNSYDPNDKTCLQGNTIGPDMIGEYLDYMIRFENTGTASAINVRVKDVIDTSKFDIDSFVPLSSSHEYYASITNGNEIEFHFDDINLDFNDATNDGYVLFKIKTLSSLTVGDSFDNTAEIYFDFNFPIITNTETVTISNTASVDEHSENSILLSPNPSQDFISLDASFTINSLVIYDVQGRLQSQYDESTTDFEAPISIAKLSKGVYFLVVKSDQGQETLKFIKK